MKDIAPSKYIMDQIHNKFGSTTLWPGMELPVAKLCSELPYIKDDATSKRTIIILKSLIEVLKNCDASDEDTLFLENEIEMHSQTKQVSLYLPEEDVVDEETVLRFVKSSLTKEGIIATKRPFNWKQNRYLTQRIFEEAKMVKFFITPERTMQGQIVAQVYETPQEIPIASVYRETKESKDGSPPIQTVLLFGDTVDKKKWTLVKQINKKYYLYKFISEENDEYLLLSEDNITMGEYVVKGVITKVNDFKKVSDSLKITTRTPYIFAYQITNRVLKFQSHNEFSKRLAILNVNKFHMFDFPFTIKTGNKNLVMLHPEWFKWLMWGWLAHSKSGELGFNDYPLHILWVAKQGTGKSAMLNCLHNRSKETRDIFSGSSSTLKRIIPSFKSIPAKVGYLAESNRFAYLDELFRCVINTNNGDGQRNESIALMNDLLEHQKREAGSGVSSVHVNMTARAIATTNPVREVNNVQDLTAKFDVSFLSRWLIYWQDDSHIDMIQNAGALVEHPFSISDNDWISIVDYLHSFKIEIDTQRVKKIINSVKPILSKELLSLYSSRHVHHLICILDGIVKARCVFDNDMSWAIKDEDYDLAEMIWKKVIRSWLESANLRTLEPKERIKYLPDDIEWMYKKICDFKKPMSRFDIEEFGVPELGKAKCYTGYQVLSDQEIIKINDDGLTVPYWWEDKNE